MYVAVCSTHWWCEYNNTLVSSSALVQYFLRIILVIFFSLHCFRKSSYVSSQKTFLPFVSCHILFIFFNFHLIFLKISVSFVWFQIFFLLVCFTFIQYFYFWNFNSWKYSFYADFFCFFLFYLSFFPYKADCYSCSMCQRTKCHG